MPQLAEQGAVVPSPRAALVIPTDVLVVAQLVLSDHVPQASSDPERLRLEGTVDSLLDQQLPERTELLVVVHAVPGDSAALDHLAIGPRRTVPASARLLVVEDEEPNRRGALVPALADLDPLPYRRVIRLRLDCEDALTPDTVADVCLIARAARHDKNGGGEKPLELATELLPQPVTVLDAPEAFTAVDAWPHTTIRDRTDHVLAAATAGGVALRTAVEPETGARTFAVDRVEVELTVARHGETITVDCDLSSFGRSNVTICYYVVKSRSRIALRWHASETAASFEGIPHGVTVRGFVRVGGTDVARAESGVL
ncbi:hypothetical protein [Brachybacterium sp. AOP24-D1-21]|uniref:hypothetical protein n=1 Tax=Brachybacterium sp. AOP24-D1-21 TaxID=3457711 RepID=UPI0040340458